MKIIVTIITFIFLIALIGLPILIIKKLDKSNIKHKFIVFLSLSIIIGAILILVLAWWGNFSNKFLLSHYGYNFEAMNDKERFENVSTDNLELVKRLEIDMMGIGWPVKAFMSYIFYFPFLIVVYLVTYFTLKKK